MARYANHECAICGELLPANEMARETSREESGHSKTYRQLGRGLGSIHSATTRRYSDRTRWVCGPCRVRRFLLYALAAGLFVLWAYWPREGDRPAQPITQTDATDRAISTLSDDGDQAPADTTALADINETADDVSAVPDDDLPVAASVKQSDPPDGTTVAAIENKRQVRDAIEAALATGEPQRWKRKKLRGYVVPSLEAVNGCRMIQITIDGVEPQPAREHCAKLSERSASDE